MAYVKPTPIVRDNKELELRADVANAVFKLIKLGNGVYKNCLNCMNWDFGNDQCKKFNAKPPTDIIVYSCPAHEDNDDIPF